MLLLVINSTNNLQLTEQSIEKERLKQFAMETEKDPEQIAKPLSKLIDTIDRIEMKRKSECPKEVGRRIEKAD
jgi:hypothetical protein